MWKTPTWTGFSTSCASGTLGRDGKTPTNPQHPLQQQAHGCDGVSPVLVFRGQLLWDDELEHQEMKTPPLLANTKILGFFFFPEEPVRRLFAAPLGLPGAQSRAQVQLLNNRRGTTELRFQESCELRGRSPRCLQHWARGFNHYRALGSGFWVSFQSPARFLACCSLRTVKISGGLLKTSSCHLSVL